MTAAALAGRTEWETGEYARDHGRTAATAIGFQLLARYIKTRAAEEMRILGITQPAEPRPYKQPVVGGTDEERKARVDAFAALHGITARPDEESGAYEAVLKFGPYVAYVVYMIPDRTMDERLAALRKAVAEREVAA